MRYDDFKDGLRVRATERKEFMAHVCWEPGDEFTIYGVDSVLPRFVITCREGNHHLTSECARLLEPVES